MGCCPFQSGSGATFLSPKRTCSVGSSFRIWFRDFKALNSALGRGAQRGEVGSAEFERGSLIKVLLESELGNMFVVQRLPFKVSQEVNRSPGALQGPPNENRRTRPGTEGDLARPPGRRPTEMNPSDGGEAKGLHRPPLTSPSLLQLSETPQTIPKEMHHEFHCKAWCSDLTSSNGLQRNRKKASTTITGSFLSWPQLPTP